MVERSGWCESIGCRGLLLQNRQGRWVFVDKPYISEEATIVMPEKRFGYHKLYSGDCIYTFRNGKTYEISRSRGWQHYPLETARLWCRDDVASNGDCKPTKLQLSRPFCHSFVRFCHQLGGSAARARLFRPLGPHSTIAVRRTFPAHPPAARSPAPARRPPAMGPTPSNVRPATAARPATRSPRAWA